MKTAVALCLLGLCLGCVSIVPSPFEGDDASAGDSAPSDAASEDAHTSVIGKACTDDPQCDDGLDCTLDKCDQDTRRCVSTPDDQPCQNGRYCDGVEKCDPQLGCVAGIPVTCDDTNSCTIDRCDEATGTCSHDRRDGDNDGDVDIHCNGTDCNDTDPYVSSKSPEICGNKIDDNCNDQIDEQPCDSPQHDTCSDPLMVQPGEMVELSLAGSKLDYSASCIPVESSSLRDVVLAIQIPDGPAMDMDVIATTSFGDLYVATASQCANPSTEIACAGPTRSDTSITSRMLARNLAPGTYPIYVFTDTVGAVSVRVVLSQATAKPTNETCGTALPITPGQATTAPIFDADTDLESECESPLGDLVYQFTLTEPHDVTVFANSVDGLGQPIVGLRKDKCVQLDQEIACQHAEAPRLFARSLPAGDYYVDVSASSPTYVAFNVILSDPTTPPEDETCDTAPLLALGVPVEVPLDLHTDDVKSTCLDGAVDAAYRIELAQVSDVLLVGRFSQDDIGAVSLSYPGCGDGDVVACSSSSPPPMRAVAHHVPAGSYRAIIESQLGNPTQITGFVRGAEPVMSVAFADICDEAVTIPLQGGFFQGNTASATANYDAGCDQAGVPPGGAPDQMLRLDLPTAKHVVFDMQGSAYRTVLNVRRGPSCPGQEMLYSCAAGYYDQRSFLDLHLDAGTYFVQVDGFAGESGLWMLDVFIADP